MRIRMGLLMLDGGRTVKELAAALDVPTTRLYYHMKILEQHGLVEVVERRMVSGIEERRYRAITDAWSMHEGELSPSIGEMGGVVRAVLGAVQGEIEVVIADQPSDSPPGHIESVVPIFTLTDLLLSTDEMAELQS